MNDELITLAINAQRNAIVPLSNYKVGAALLCEDDTIYTGCNIEDPSGIGITNCCAERLALLKALSENQRDFKKIAIVGGPNGTDITTPCGACRQYLNSFAPDIVIITWDGDEIYTQKLNDLLPNTFDKSFSKSDNKTNI